MLEILFTLVFLVIELRKNGFVVYIFFVFHMVLVRLTLLNNKNNDTYKICANSLTLLSLLFMPAPKVYYHSKGKKIIIKLDYP